MFIVTFDAKNVAVLCTPTVNKVNGKPNCADADLFSGVIIGYWKRNGYLFLSLTFNTCLLQDERIISLKKNPTSLPLSATAIKSLAVVGPNAKITKTMISNYEGY
ncbi:hypothetical protein C5167_031446 [Papaver somniferum]|uniref:Uncharacterized protein n=1 Tax=Papaver somniferum TaxID=3469 RepID=A0A4Y7K7K3_PAPSO|nr:hypothetical protein C5167_031446 [Papaver somniferum]